MLSVEYFLINILKTGNLKSVRIISGPSVDRCVCKISSSEVNLSVDKDFISRNHNVCPSSISINHLQSKSYIFCHLPDNNEFNMYHFLPLMTEDNLKYIKFPLEFTSSILRGRFL